MTISEIATTATVVTDVTTTTTTIATEKQTFVSTKETEITQATKDTSNTPESEVYLFDYHSLDETPLFTDIDGTECVYGLGMLATPDEERYLFSYSEDKIELGIRHFKKSEYDAYMDSELDDEPEEQYFVLVFEKTDEVWKYKNTYEPIKEIYFAGCEETPYKT